VADDYMPITYTSLKIDNHASITSFNCTTILLKIQFQFINICTQFYLFSNNLYAR